MMIVLDVQAPAWLFTVLVGYLTNVPRGKLDKVNNYVRSSYIDYMIHVKNES